MKVLTCSHEPQGKGEEEGVVTKSSSARETGNAAKWLDLVMVTNSRSNPVLGL